jgi:hypothetical protein
MRDPSREELIEAYLAHARSVAADASDERLFWAYERIHDLVHEDPEALWMLLPRIVVGCDDDLMLAYVAASPLEELICDHGPRFIDRIEAEAAVNPRFLRALTGVWGRSVMAPDVAARLDALVKDQPPL